MIRIKAHKNIVCQTERIINEELSQSCESQTDGVAGNINFVVPETIKASVERIIINFKAREKQGMSLVDGDVLSFMRLSRRILEMCGIGMGGVDNKILLRNAIYRIITEHKDEFKTLNKLVKRVDYISMIIDLLGDFVRYQITYDALFKILDTKSCDNELTESYKDKVCDFALLMKYIEEFNQVYGLKLLQNPIAKADAILKRIIDNKDLKNEYSYYELIRFIKGKFVFVGFGVDRAFTPEEISFVKNLSLLGADITINVLSNGDLNNNSKIYYFGNRLIKDFMDIPDIIIEETTGKSDKTTLNNTDDADDIIGKVDLISDLNVQTANKNFADILLSYALDIPCKTESPKTAITCGEFKNLDDRISYICNEIIRLTREENYRYRDIRIAVIDEDIVPRLSGIMRMYGLDSFVNNEVVLSNTPIVRYAIKLLKLPKRNFYIYDVLDFLRTGVLNIHSEIIDLFENFLLRHNLVYGDRILDEKYYINEKTKNEYKTFYVGEYEYKNKNLGHFLFENVVFKYLMPAYALCQDIKNEKLLNRKAEILARQIDSKKETMEHIRNELLSRQESVVAMAIIQGYKELMGLLVSFMQEMNKVDISYDDFLDMVEIDMSSKTIGGIPLTVDSIEIGPPSLCYLTSCKVMFVIGDKSNNFPYTKSSEGIMADNELKILSKSLEDDNIMLPDKLLTKNKQEFIVASLLLNGVTDKLFFVHEYGESESSVYSYIKEYAAEFLCNCFVAPVYGTPIESNHQFDKAFIDPLIIDKLFGEEDRELQTSVSQIEKFNNCHMMYMLDKILKVRKRDDNTKFMANNVGSLAHAMLEYSFREVNKECDTLEKLNEYKESLLNDNARKLDELMRNALEFAINQSEYPDAKEESFKVNPGIKTTRITRKATIDLLNECIETRMRPEFFEYKIGDKNKLTISVNNILNGDKNNNNQVTEREFVFSGMVDRIDKSFDSDSYKIYDYKTGNTVFDGKKLINGTQIQMFAYALALTESKTDYMNVTEVAYSKINMKPSKDEALKITAKSIDFDEEQFPTVLKYVRKVLKDSCNDIVNGKSDALPYDKDTCKYCDYIGVCGNKITQPQTREKVFYNSRKKGLQPCVDKMNEILEGENND